MKYQIYFYIPNSDSDCAAPKESIFINAKDSKKAVDIFFQENSEQEIS